MIFVLLLLLLCCFCLIPSCAFVGLINSDGFGVLIVVAIAILLLAGMVEKKKE